MRERKNGAPVLCMQGSYHADKPFFDALKTFFVVTIFPAFISEILRKNYKNWRVFGAPGIIAASRLWPYL
jgi:hypothetical protein